MSKNKIKVKKSFAPVMLAAVVLMFLAMILMPMIALAADICAKDEIVLQVPIPGIPGIGYCVKGFPEYLEKQSERLCNKKVVMSHFNNNKDYQNYATENPIVFIGIFIIAIIIVAKILAYFKGKSH